MLHADIVIRSPTIRPVHRNFVFVTVVRRGLVGLRFCTRRKFHFLNYRCDAVSVAIVFAAVNQAREFAGDRICGKQNAWLERLQAEPIFRRVDVEFDKRRIAVIVREMLSILGKCLGD